MRNISSESGLKEAILELEQRQAEEESKLKAQLLVAVESIQPINIIKSTLREATSLNSGKGDLLSSSVGMAAGLLVKLLLGGIIRSPLKKVVGTVAMFGVTKLVANHPETVRSLGKGLLKMIRHKPPATTLPA